MASPFCSKDQESTNSKIYSTKVKKESKWYLAVSMWLAFMIMALFALGKYYGKS